MHKNNRRDYERVAPEIRAAPAIFGACCGGIIGLISAHTLPILFLCLGFLLPNIDDGARLGLKWTGYSLLIMLWSIICCTVLCGLAAASRSSNNIESSII